MIIAVFGSVFLKLLLPNRDKNPLINKLIVPQLRVVLSGLTALTSDFLYQNSLGLALRRKQEGH
jgi:hypothetical protein